MLCRVRPFVFRSSCSLLNQGVASFPSCGASSFHSTSLVNSSKSDLAALRKKTGYSLSICKKALTETTDLASAEKWLKDQAQAQGWAKAQKLQGRNTTQGLLGIKVKGNTAALVELSCETDFVARNSKFIRILDTIAASCLKISAPQNIEKLANSDLSSSEVGALTAGEGSTLADLVALNIGQIGENMVIGDATVIHSEKGVNLVGLSHPNLGEAGEKLHYGRYVTLMAYSTAGKGSEHQLASQVCQHIIGMAPTSLSNEEDKENSLMHQPFLHDEEQTVGEVVGAAGITIINFIRKEVGRKE